MIQIRIILLSAILALLSINNKSDAQSLVDVSVGSSNSDHVFSTIALRKQLTERFRVGVEVQASNVRYRFIEGKPMRKGYSTLISLPVLYKLFETEHIRLDLYTRVGVRFQGVIDPDGNDKRDETLTSRAVNIEPGLMVSIPVSERCLIHSGVTMPNFFELKPKFLYENNISAITSGVSYKTSENKIFFLKCLAGGAAGADGDSQKFTWSAQAGFRFLLGNKIKGNPLVLRSGPINNKTFGSDLPSGVTYKGKSHLQLRADHGAFGLMIAPAFKLPNTNIEIDLPIMIGSIGGGFYLAGEDRKTPDGKRVSEWENELFQEKDAAFGGLTEFGVRALFPTKNPSVKVGVGVHYTMVSDQKTYYDPTGEFYNNKLRTSIVVQFGNAKR